jgi:hypothetical protein
MIWGILLIPLRLLWLPIKWTLAFNAWVMGIFGPIFMWFYNIIMWPVHFTEKIVAWVWNLLTLPIQWIYAIQLAILNFFLNLRLSIRAWIEEKLPLIWKIIVRYEYLASLPAQVFLVFVPVDIILILVDEDLSIVGKAIAVVNKLLLGVEIEEEISEEISEEVAEEE